MNLITILLQAAAEGQRGGGLSMWIMLILIFVVMWVFMIMPQRKQQKEAEAFRKGLKKGDKVVTAGGIYGTIAEVKENERFVVLRVDKDVTIKIDKSSLQKDPSAAPVVSAVSAEPKKETKESKDNKDPQEPKAEKY